MSDTPDVTALRDALVDDIRKELVRKGLRPSMSNVLRARVDALIAAARADATRAAEAEVAGLRADNERMTRELEAWNSIPRWSNQRMENAMTTSGHELAIDGSQFMCPIEPVWFEDWDTAARHIARVAVAALAAQPAAPEAERWVRTHKNTEWMAPEQLVEAMAKPAPEAEPERCAWDKGDEDANLEPGEVCGGGPDDHGEREVYGHPFTPAPR